MNRHWNSYLNRSLSRRGLLPVSSACVGAPALGRALLELHTGSDTFVRPSLGSWITYGLGSENQSMPGFITICPTQSHGGANNYSSAFLPAPYAGTPIGAVGIKARDARIPYIANAETPREIQLMVMDFAKILNREQY